MAKIDPMNVSGPFEFRHLAASDLPRLLDWLSRPHLREWWREEEPTMDGLREKYLPRIAGAEAAHPFLGLEESGAGAIPDRYMP